jgi:hypothetical protein
MSLTKKIASRLAKLARKAQVRRLRALSLNRFGIERLEERQLLAADFMAGEVLVQFDPSMTEEMRATVRPAGSTVVETIHTAMMQRVGEGVMERIQLASSMTVEQGVEHFQDLNGVKFAEPNFIVTTAAVSNDTFIPMVHSGVCLAMTPQPRLAREERPTHLVAKRKKFGTKTFFGSKSVVVGVIDTG